MALVDNAWYVNFGDGATTGYYAVTKWANKTAVAGEIIRQFTTPAVGSERCFVCTVGGPTGSTEPTWVNTRGAKNVSSSATYQECTGIAALNGDATNTPSWTITATPPGGVKNTAVTLGQVIKRDNGASYQICTTAGTAGNGAEPAFSNTAGTTTADNTVTWTSLGVVGNFTGWQAPHARLENACATNWGRVGNSFFLATESAQSQASGNIQITSPGTAASPCFIYSVTKTNVPPTSANLSVGASISSITASATILLDGFAYCYGVAITSGSGATGSSISLLTNTSGYWSLDTCALNLGGTGGGNIRFGGGGSTRGQRVDLINTTLGWTANSQFILISDVILNWRNTASAITGGTLPTSLFSAGVFAGTVTLTGVDLSALGSGKTLVAAQQVPIKFNFINCKLGSSVTVAATPTDQGSAITDLIVSDSGATNYRAERYWYAGTQSVETTIVRTGGATDGTTPISQKIVTTANSKWTSPFESHPISIWNDSTSAITTLTIYGTTTGGGVPKDDEIWVEVEYLGASGSPLGSFITSTKANNLAASAATNNSSDASTWAGGGAGNGFKIVVPSFTPGQKGPINITVKTAKVSSTYYIDPKPSISGVTVSKSLILAPGVYANELQAGAHIATRQQLGM